jgi:hypothetical protein
MGNCHFKTDFDAENITGKIYLFIRSKPRSNTNNGN